MESPEIDAYIEETNKALSGKGRLLLRASGTEPLIRIMAEGESAEACDRIIEEAKAKIYSLKADALEGE